MKRDAVLLICCCAMLQGGLAAPATGNYFPPPESQGGWRKLEKPDEIRQLAGMDPAKLDELRTWLLQSDKRNFAAVVVRNGYIVLEVERGNSAVTHTGNVKSCAKAICATVLAIASEKSRHGGTPRRMSFEDKAFDFIPWAHPLSDPRKAQITVKQLFNHTSGITPESTKVPNRGPWELILGHAGDKRNCRLAFDPGTDLDYTTHAFYHAALVCENVTGQPYDQFAVEHLFRPLGIERWWFEFFDGETKYGRHPSHAVGLPARELARLAYCLLRNGRWAGRQVVPEWFVRETAAPTHTVTGVKSFGRDAQSFSHGWELPGLLGGTRGAGIPQDARFKPGSGGQLIAFVPSLDLVVTRQTGGSGQWEYEEYLRRACAAVVSTNSPAISRLKVSENGRFLVTENGKPFFWLGDTAWHMFGKSVREPASNQPPLSLYFSNRAAKGFTVIQSVIVRKPIGSEMFNAHGFEPFENGDWSRPRLRPGPNDDYWDHIDWCIAEAKRHGLYMAALPLWLSDIREEDRIVKPQVAYRYGHFLGSRYRKEPHLIWVLGGDAPKGRNVDNPKRLAMIRAMAEGIADGVNGVDNFDGQADWSTTLMTFHPPGGDHSSSEWLHHEPWLDFNMIQTTTRFNFSNWRTVERDYALQPPKPTLDAEVAYEDSLSLRKSEPQDRRIRPWDVRRAAYWNVFAGGFGHTYGHRSFIGWIRKGETYRYGAYIPWYESLDAPGAFQVGHLRRLMESRPFLTRIPNQSIIVGDTLSGEDHLQATRDSQGTYAMVYSPSGKPIKIRMDKISGPKVRACWFNPRDGTATVIGEFPNKGEREFTPPTNGEGNDWVLVLDDAAQNFPPPGIAVRARD